MIAGHYATALIAHQKFPKGTLLFFLIVSQLQDLLWFIFHYLGLEATNPADVFGQISLGLYAKNVCLAIFIEVVFVIAALWFYFRQEVKAGIVRSKNNKMIIIGVFVYATIFLLSIATISVRQLLGLPQFDLGINTSIPTIAITYAALMWVLHRAVSNAYLQPPTGS